MVDLVELLFQQEVVQAGLLDMPVVVLEIQVVSVNTQIKIKHGVIIIHHIVDKMVQVVY